MKDISQFSSLLKPLFSLGLIVILLSACAGRQLDVEEFSNGNRSLKSSASTLSGATDETARVKAEQEADKICQREGRAVSVKNITSVPNATTGLINVEIEFRCEPKVYQRISQ